MKNLLIILSVIISMFAHTEYLEKNIYTLSKVNRIPKIIHQIWVGKNKLPEKYKAYMQSWKDKHPDWTYKLWTDEDIEDFEWTNRKHFDRAKNPGMKADIWRYEIIHQYGGIYVDCDMECVRSIEPLHERLEFYASYNGNKKCLGNHMFAAMSGSELMLRCVNLLKRSLGHKDLENCTDNEIQGLTGPDFFTYAVRERVVGIDNPREIILPKEYFQPVEFVHCGHALTIDEKVNVLDKCFAIHHNGLSWVKEKWIL